MLKELNAYPKLNPIIQCLTVTRLQESHCILQSGMVIPIPCALIGKGRRAMCIPAHHMQGRNKPISFGRSQSVIERRVKRGLRLVCLRWVILSFTGYEWGIKQAHPWVNRWTRNNVGALGSRLHLGYDTRRGISLGWMSILMKVRHPRALYSNNWNTQT